jgi:hypothetical protein
MTIFLFIWILKVIASCEGNCLIEDFSGCAGLGDSQEKPVDRVQVFTAKRVLSSLPKPFSFIGIYCRDSTHFPVCTGNLIRITAHILHIFQN